MHNSPIAAYAFAAELQAFAESHKVRITSIRAETTRNDRRDFLSVYFSVPRPRTRKHETTEEAPVETTVEPDEMTTDSQIGEPAGNVALETTITELEKELGISNTEGENDHEI